MATIAPARAMLKKVRVKIKNADKPGPSASSIKKQKKKARAKAKEAGESAPISRADVAAIMEDSPDKDEDSASPSTGLGLGVEIQQNGVVEQPSKEAVESSSAMDVDEPEPASSVEGKTAVGSPPRTSSTTPKPRQPPPSLPSPPPTASSSSSPPPSQEPSLATASPATASAPTEDPTISSSSSSTSDAIVSSTSTSTETAATSAFDSPLTPRSEAREVSLDRSVAEAKAPATLAKPAARHQVERRTSLVEMETVKLEIELDDDEDDDEVVFGRVERTVVPEETTPKQEMSSPEQDETETVAPPPSDKVDAAPTVVVSGYAWDGSYAPAREPREMEFEAGIWLMVCGQYVSARPMIGRQTCRRLIRPSCFHHPD